MKYLKPIISSLIKHMTKLVIVESPAKCKKIESYLGPGYKCIASFGHIRDLADGLKGIDIKNNFKPTFRLLPGKSKYQDRIPKDNAWIYLYC